MPNIRKSKSHAASDALAKEADPAGFEQRREDFVQRMITEGLAKLEHKLKTRKGKRVFRDEVKFQKGLHKEAVALRTVVATKHRRELMLLETAVKAARTINWKGFVQAARPLRRKLGGRALQVMWWATNTSERATIQITDLHKWMKGRSRLNNELAIRLRAKLAMFSDLIAQIRAKARMVYRDGDPRFQTFCLEALMLEYSAMADRAAEEEALAEAAAVDAHDEEDDDDTRAGGLCRPSSSSMLDMEAALAASGGGGGGAADDDGGDRHILMATVQLSGAGVAHTYKQVLNKNQPTQWELQHARTADLHVGAQVTVQIGARSFLTTVPDVPQGSLFSVPVPDWMRAYLADQEESDFLSSCRAARYQPQSSSSGMRRHTSAHSGSGGGDADADSPTPTPTLKKTGGGSVKKDGYTASMLDVILMDDEEAAAVAAPGGGPASPAPGTTSAGGGVTLGASVGDRTVKEGNLKKQGAKLGLWHTRYFRLHVHFLAYWKSKGSYQRGQQGVKSARPSPTTATSTSKVFFPDDGAGADGSSSASPAHIKRKVSGKKGKKKNKEKTVQDVIGRSLEHAKSPFAGASFVAPPSAAMASEPGCEHNTVTALQATYAATATPEACFDLHLLQSAVVERADIVLTFTAAGGSTVVRRLRAESHAAALSWQEAIYQHFTWYCTSKETELLAFVNMAQQQQARRATSKDAGLDRAEVDSNSNHLPRTSSADCVLGAVTKSRRTAHRKHGLLNRVGGGGDGGAAGRTDTPRTRDRKMKSKMTSHAEAEARRHQRRDQLLAEIEAAGSASSSSAAQRTGHARRLRKSGRVAATALAAATAHAATPAAPGTPPPRFRGDSDSTASLCEDAPDTPAETPARARPQSTSLFRLALAAAPPLPTPEDAANSDADSDDGGDDDDDEGVVTRRGVPAAPAAAPARERSLSPRRKLRTDAGCMAVNTSRCSSSRSHSHSRSRSRQPDSAMSPHERVLVGARRPGWGRSPEQKEKAQQQTAALRLSLSPRHHKQQPQQQTGRSGTPRKPMSPLPPHQVAHHQARFAGSTRSPAQRRAASRRRRVVVDDFDSDDEDAQLAASSFGGAASGSRSSGGASSPGSEGENHAPRQAVAAVAAAAAATAAAAAGADSAVPPPRPARKSKGRRGASATKAALEKSLQKQQQQQAAAVLMGASRQASPPRPARPHPKHARSGSGDSSGDSSTGSTGSDKHRSVRVIF